MRAAGREQLEARRADHVLGCVHHDPGRRPGGREGKEGKKPRGQSLPEDSVWLRVGVHAPCGREKPVFGTGGRKGREKPLQDQHSGPRGLCFSPARRVGRLRAKEGSKARSQAEGCVQVHFLAPGASAPDSC